jgi:hypothetical protein
VGISYPAGIIAALAIFVYYVNVAGFGLFKKQ